MDDHAALLQAQNLVHLPAQLTNNTGWCVKFCDKGMWKQEGFTLAEDAWNFFYTKLAELKKQFLGIGLGRQKGS